jgi:hypothetical protein
VIDSTLIALNFLCVFSDMIILIDHFALMAVSDQLAFVLMPFVEREWDAHLFSYFFEKGNFN